MPIVHVHLWKGRDAETKKKIIEGMTKVFTDLDIPKQAVTVVIQDTPKENWGIGGVPASELDF